VRRALLRILGIALASVLGVAVWAWLIEPRWLRVEHVPVHWTGGAMRVVVLSDLHARPSDEANVLRLGFACASRRSTRPSASEAELDRLCCYLHVPKVNGKCAQSGWPPVLTG
jgi:hypothetical protein